MPTPKEVTVKQLVAKMRDACQFWVDVVTTDLSDLGSIPPGVGVPANVIREQDLSADLNRMQNAISALDNLKPHLAIIHEAFDMAYVTVLVSDELGDDGPTCDKCDAKLDPNNQFEMHTGVCGDCNKNRQQKSEGLDEPDTGDYSAPSLEECFGRRDDD
jgi:hypothetical protein